jgi:hypothetical protein
MQMPSLHQIRRSRPCLPADPHPRRCLLGHWGYGPGGGAAPRSAPSPIRSLPRMGPPTRGTVEIAHPRRSRPASPRAGLRRVLLGHSRYDPGGGGASTPAHAQYDLCPGWAPDPGHWRYRTSVLQPPPQLRGRSEVRPHGALRAGAGGGGSTAGAPAQYDLCPRWPDRPGALRVSCVEAASPVLLNTISAPDGPTTPGHCGYRRVTAIFYDPRPGGYPQGNRPMRGTGRISCGAPRVQDPGHPPSRPGAVTVALSDRLQPSRRP